MATRFYFPVTNSEFGSGINQVAFDSSWDNISNAFRLRLLHRKEGTGPNVNILKAGTGVSNNNVSPLQLISIPMEGQIITGTVKGIIQVRETNATDNYMPQLVARVVSYDGQTVRGTLYASENQAITNEFLETGLQNRKFPRNWGGSGDTITDVTALVGDRLCLEIGFRQESTSVATARITAGEVLTVDDCAENETDTLTSLSPWIEFSHNFRWYPILAGRRAGTRF